MDEVRRLSEENGTLQSYLGVSRETIQQQNGIILSLQKVVEGLQTSVEQAHLASV
jgi:hypothetical protein